jgi:hypothetical protein
MRKNKETAGNEFLLIPSSKIINGFGNPSDLSENGFMNT